MGMVRNDHPDEVKVWDDLRTLRQCTLSSLSHPSGCSCIGQISIFLWLGFVTDGSDDDSAWSKGIGDCPGVNRLLFLNEWRVYLIQRSGVFITQDIDGFCGSVKSLLLLLETDPNYPSMMLMWLSRSPHRYFLGQKWGRYYHQTQQ